MPVTYNPYKFSTFVTKPDDNPIYAADVVRLQRRLVLSGPGLDSNNQLSSPLNPCSNYFIATNLG
jgi:hypothetical protein